MPSPVVPPPIPEQIFFQSFRTYRNLRSLFFVAFSLLAATPFTLGVIDHLTHRPAGMVPVPLLYIGAAIFLIPAFVVGSNALRNVRDLIQIDSEGIRWRHNFWYWTQVKSLAPEKVNFSNKYYLRVNLAVDPRICRLQPNEPFTPRSYADLLGRLKAFLDVHHPAIKLEGLR